MRVAGMIFYWYPPLLDEGGQGGQIPAHTTTKPALRIAVCLSACRLARRHISDLSVFETIFSQK